MCAAKRAGWATTIAVAGEHAARSAVAILDGQLPWADGRIFRNLIDTDGESRKGTTESRLCIRVSLGTCRLFYEAGQEDSLVRRRSEGEYATLAARALARTEERRRSRWLK